MKRVPVRRNRLAGLVVLALLGCFAATAQTPQLQTYSVEVTVPLSQVGANPAPTGVPANILQALQAGALEIRHSLTYSAPNSRMSVRTFLVQPGAPNPTPAAGQSMLTESYEVNVENVFWGAQTVAPPGTNATSIVITGRIGSSSTSILGNLVNKLFVHSAGYDTGRFTNLTTVISGTSTIYAAQGTGTLSAGGTSGGGPGTGGNRPPVVVVTAGNNATTAQVEIQLDASGSSDPEGAPLSFSWRSIGKTAAVINRNSAKPSVQFAEGFGEYVFEVTATDDQGISATGQVRVLYVGR
jgi:hypothetical protein